MSGFNAGPHVTTLTNGLVLIIDRKPWIKGAYCNAHVRLGSCDEDYEESQGLCDQGLCHLLEHSLFRGSKDFDESEILSRTVGLGGTFDADTDRHVTSYMGWSPSGELPTLLETIDSMIFRSNIDLKSLEEERAAVIGEIERLNSDPVTAARDASLALLYPHHKVRFPVYGTVETVQEIRATRIREIIRGFHKPQNAVLCLSGSLPDDLEIEDIVYKHARGFSHRTRAANSEDIGRDYGDPTPESDHLERTDVLPRAGKEFASVLSVPIPRDDEGWNHTASVVSRILAGNNFGELDREFGSIPELTSFGILQENLVDLSVMSLYVSGVYSEKTILKVKNSMDSLVKRLSKGRIGDEQLELAKTRTASGLSLAKNNPFPFALGMRHALGEWWTPAETDIPLIREVDKKHASAMMKRMFAGESRATFLMIPE